MTPEQLKPLLRTLTLEGLGAIAGSAFGIDGFQGAIAYYDSRNDELVTTLAPFKTAVEALERSPTVATLFGSNEAPRLALQFVFNAYDHVASRIPPENAFEKVWESFVHELATPTWTFAAVANIQNLECAQGTLELVDGVSVRARSFKELEALLDWGSREIDFLVKDWMATAGSSFVLLVQKKVPKTPENFLVVGDGTEYTRVARALQALRLVGPGDVRIGRLFLARPARFNIGIGGMQGLGFSLWHPGTTYKLSAEKLPSIQRWYWNLAALDGKKDRQTRSLSLALRSFSAIYDRHRQTEDIVLDAITALEALWKLDTELAFRLAFRTAALLGDTDDERVSIYQAVSQYYRIRSKIVHGAPLSSETYATLVGEHEPIRSIVRRALCASLHLANNPGDWSLARLDREADAALLHSNQRHSLRVAMDLVHQDAAEPAHAPGRMPAGSRPPACGR